jgi:hypothetical protein
MRAKLAGVGIDLLWCSALFSLYFLLPPSAASVVPHAGISAAGYKIKFFKGVPVAI